MNKYQILFVVTSITLAILSIIIPILQYPLLMLTSTIQRYNIKLSFFTLRPFLIVYGVILIYFVVKNIKHISKLKKFYKYNHTLAIFFLPILADIISFYTSIDRRQTIEATIFHIISISVAIYVYTYLSNIRGQKKLINISLAVTTGIILLVFTLQLVLYYTGHINFLRKIELLLNSNTAPIDHFRFKLGDKIIIRASSLFMDPNMLAGFLIIPISIVWIKLISKSTSQRKTIIYSTFLIILMIVFAVIFSRSATIGLLVTILVSIYLLIRYKNISLKPLIELFLIAIIIITPVFIKIGIRPVYSFIKERLITNIQGQFDYSTIGHLKHFSSLKNVLKISPLTGMGTGNYSTYYNNYVDKSTRNAYSHSIIVNTITENGILGFILYVIFIFSLLASTCPQKANKIHVSLWTALIGLLVANIFYLYFWEPWTWVIIGTLVAL